MGTKLYVGNLSYGIKSSDLEQMFAAHGPVTSAQVISDRETQRSKGFGFVTMNDQAELQKAISMFNGNDFNGRPLTVNVAANTRLLLTTDLKLAPASFERNSP